MTVLYYDSLPSNAFYHEYFPIIALSLSTVYILSYFIMYGLRQFRLYRDRRKQQEKRRLYQYWLRCHGDNLQWKHIREVLTFPPFTYNTSSCTLNAQTSTRGIAQTKKIRFQPMKYQWINRHQRLTLLWHWSVSMGYVEYDHGKGLDALVQHLSVVRSKSCLKSYSALEKVVVEA